VHALQQQFSGIPLLTIKANVDDAELQTPFQSKVQVAASKLEEACNERNAAFIRIEELTRALSQSHIRAAECSANLHAFKALFISAQNDFASCKQNYADECSSLRLAASRIASQKVALTNDISLLRNSYLKENDAALAAQEKLASENLSLIQERDGLVIKVNHLTKELECLRCCSLEATEFQKIVPALNANLLITLSNFVQLPDSDSSLIGLAHRTSDRDDKLNAQLNPNSAEAHVELKDVVDQAFAASQRLIAELRERVIKSEAALDRERVIHTETTTRLECMGLQLNESNANLAQKVSDFDSILQQNAELQKLSKESKIGLEFAMTQIQQLITERTRLQHDSSQLKVDLYELQARFASLEGTLRVCDNSKSVIELLEIDKGTLVKELEDLEFSAQKQVDSWQCAAAVAKREALEMNTSVEKLVHENHLLLLSLENKVIHLPCSIYWSR
jgi:hypothetical protein